MLHPFCLLFLLHFLCAVLVWSSGVNATSCSTPQPEWFQCGRDSLPGPTCATCKGLASPQLVTPCVCNNATAPIALFIEIPTSCVECPLSGCSPLPPTAAPPLTNGDNDLQIGVLECYAEAEGISPNLSYVLGIQSRSLVQVAFQTSNPKTPLMRTGAFIPPPAGQFGWPRFTSRSESIPFGHVIICVAGSNGYLALRRLVSAPSANISPTLKNRRFFVLELDQTFVISAPGTRCNLAVLSSTLVVLDDTRTLNIVYDTVVRNVPVHFEIANNLAISPNLSPYYTENYAVITQLAVSNTSWLTVRGISGRSYNSPEGSSLIAYYFSIDAATLTSSILQVSLHHLWLVDTDYFLPLCSATMASNQGAFGIGPWTKPRLAAAVGPIMLMFVLTGSMPGTSSLHLLAWDTRNTSATQFTVYNLTRLPFIGEPLCVFAMESIELYQRTSSTSGTVGAVTLTWCLPSLDEPYSAFCSITLVSVLSDGSLRIAPSVQLPAVPAQHPAVHLAPLAPAAPDSFAIWVIDSTAWVVVIKVSLAGDTAHVFAPETWSAQQQSSQSCEPDVTLLHLTSPTWPLEATSSIVYAVGTLAFCTEHTSGEIPGEFFQLFSPVLHSPPRSTIVTLDSSQDAFFFSQPGFLAPDICACYYDQDLLYDYCPPAVGQYEYTCSCDGAVGGTCTEPQEFCVQGKCVSACDQWMDPCDDEATCNTTGSGVAVCECPPGTTGPRCSQVAEPCHSSPCTNGGSCEQTLSHGAFSCHCLYGFTGILCESVSDYCKDGLCPTNRSSYVACTTTSTEHYECLCRNDMSSTALSVCATSPNNGCASSPCLHGRCNQFTSTFNCTCEPPYFGAHCGEAPNKDCMSSPCLHGTCHQFLTSSHCACEVGYTGTLCDTLVDECASGPCANGGTCALSEPGSFACTCLSQYAGSTCRELVSPCSKNPCESGTCQASPQPVGGSWPFRCLCDMEHTGTQCETYIDLCASTPCTGAGSCSQGPLGIKCACEKFYTGAFCETNMCVAACASSPCAVGSAECTCHTSATSGEIQYVCHCAPGMAGATCGESAACSSSPCLNGAECNLDSIVSNQAVCVCRAGFTGLLCQHAELCASSPCSPDFTCFPDLSSASYSCSYMGCQSNPCLNGATCKSGDKSYMCTCPPLYTGRVCGVALVQPCADGCGESRCVNGACTVRGTSCPCASVSPTPTSVPLPPPSSVPSSSNSKVVLIVIGIGSGLAVICACVFLWCRGRRTRQQRNDFLLEPLVANTGFDESAPFCNTLAHDHAPVHAATMNDEHGGSADQCGSYMESSKDQLVPRSPPMPRSMVQPTAPPLLSRAIHLPDSSRGHTCNADDSNEAPPPYEAPSWK